MQKKPPFHNGEIKKTHNLLVKMAITAKTTAIDNNPIPVFKNCGAQHSTTPKNMNTMLTRSNITTFFIVLLFLLC